MGACSGDLPLYLSTPHRVDVLPPLDLLQLGLEQRQQAGSTLTAGKPQLQVSRGGTAGGRGGEAVAPVPPPGGSRGSSGRRLVVLQQQQQREKIAIPFFFSLLVQGGFQPGIPGQP